jgi:thiamine-phosphate pyrophosphorylase
MSAAGALVARLRLMVLTDPACGPDRSIVEVVRASLRGGAPAVQIRAKGGDTRDMLELALALRVETTRAGALLFVNDRVDVALASDADGAHVGDDDIPLEVARRIAPQGFLLGRSVNTADEAVIAMRQDADYLGVGPVFSTPSKADAGDAIGADGIAMVRSVTSLPIVAIGGLDLDNSAEIAAAGADGVAVIRAVMQAGDPEDATRRLLSVIEDGLSRQRR